MRYLCMDILYDRGSVPVGEIGKLVQELTGSVSLSAILKDRYGGLKKFLEIYPHDFVIRLVVFVVTFYFAYLKCTLF